ncbi:MAG: glycosyltransferase family A protein [Lactobacillus sp.]
MNNRLTIILYNAESADSKLVRALTSIRFQIGIKMTELKIIVVGQQRRLITSTDLSLLHPLNLTWVTDSHLTKGELLNQALAQATGQWVTFMDARDMFFSDGALLDFYQQFRQPHLPYQLLIYKYVYTVSTEKQLVDFKTADYLAYPYAKYFKVDFLKQQSLAFNPDLAQYLLEDFTSRAVEVCAHPLWLDLNHYYLSLRPSQADDFSAFITYRQAFLTYIKHHQSSQELYVRDVVWSIVRAWGILIASDQPINRVQYDQLAQLVQLLTDVPNYQKLLTAELKRQNLKRDLPYQKLLLRG